VEKAKQRGLRIMVGGVVSTSLGMAPALLVAQQAEIVDLDGPLRLALDRGAGLRYDGSTIHQPDPKLWGGPSLF
jgi:L-alanine-DL-glutamate epimerase-like enolase superfamily enzyme